MNRATRADVLVALDLAIARARAGRADLEAQRAVVAGDDHPARPWRIFLGDIAGGATPGPRVVAALRSLVAAGGAAVERFTDRDCSWTCFYLVIEAGDPGAAAVIARTSVALAGADPADPFFHFTIVAPTAMRTGAYRRVHVPPAETLDLLDALARA